MADSAVMDVDVPLQPCSTIFPKRLFGTKTVVTLAQSEICQQLDTYQYIKILMCVCVCVSDGSGTFVGRD